MLEQKQLNDLSQKVASVVGQTKLSELSEVQRQMCEVLLTKRLEKVQFQVDQIQDEELMGIYELVVNELQPIDLPQ